MKKNVLVRSMLLVGFATIALTACGGDKKEAESSEAVSSAVVESSEVATDNANSTSSETATSETSEESNQTSDSASASGTAITPFQYSKGFDANGYWASLKGKDFVKLVDYKNIQVPADVHTVKQEDLDKQINTIVVPFSTSKNVTDRAVKDGDTVNIDYVGSVDGVEFAGGTTQGQGTDVVLGVTQYIEGFLPQLIGKTPGETFDLHVTFPANYGNEALNGKAAVFKTTINHIVEKVAPELTDDFVKTNLEGKYGWTSVDEMKTKLSQMMKDNAIRTYVQNEIIQKSTFEQAPAELLDYQERSMISYYNQMATAYNMSYEEFLKSFLQEKDEASLLLSNKAKNEDTAKYMGAFLKIAESENIAVTEADIEAFFEKNTGSKDYTQHKETYGMNYLAYLTLMDKANQVVLDNAKLQ